MTTFLLTWNPDAWNWQDLGTLSARNRAGEILPDTWTTGRTRRIVRGDRVFLMRLGKAPKGICGAGRFLDTSTEQPHYDEARAAAGERALRAPVEFDTLLDIDTEPPLPVSLLQAEFPDVTWTPQASGISITDECAQKLERLWDDHVRSCRPSAPDLPRGLVDRFRERWEACRKNKESEAAWAETTAERRRVIGEMLETLGDLRSGRIDVEEFRQAFDTKTRSTWDYFGLKGLAGAMFLNQLVKHLGDSPATARLGEALLVPADEAGGHAIMRQYHALVSDEARTRGVGLTSLNPRRVPFLLSAWWHVQQPEFWPIAFDSARIALRSEGALFQSDDPVFDYFRLFRCCRALRSGLGVDAWTLERLLLWIKTKDASSDSVPPPAPPSEAKERIWLIGTGRDGELWESFQKKKMIGIGWRELGDLRSYETAEAYAQKFIDLGDFGTNPQVIARACHGFGQEMQPGDRVYAKKQPNIIVGYGVIEGEYEYHPEALDVPHQRRVRWEKTGQWTLRDRNLTPKTLTQIAPYPELVRQLRRDVDVEAGPGAEKKVPYGAEEARADLLLPEGQLERMHRLLMHKKNLILQGPPGVGKTFIAERLAYLVIGTRDPDYVRRVQFHQSYSYEDFVRGYRPAKDGGFVLKDGPFLDFCEQALQDQDSPHILIIDEINRGNLSRIFGELMVLIEADKRSADWATHLAYARSTGKNGDKAAGAFFVPENLYIIGMMNTADRSLALVDYALRRRFGFFTLEPAFGTEAFSTKLEAMQVDSALRTAIIQRFTDLNQQIAEDRSLGPGYRVGHSYFCQGKPPFDREWYEQILEFEIVPLLEEYWPDDRDRVARIAMKLREK